MTVYTTSENLAPDFRNFRRSPAAWAAVLLIGIGLLARIPSLTESLWYDEVIRTHVILSSQSLTQYLFYDCHNFLYNSLLMLWIHIFGDSEISIRIPSLLFGFSAAVIFSRWVAAYAGRTVAWAVFLWAALCPFHVWYSTEAKNNAAVIFFAAAIFVTHCNLLDAEDRKRLALAIAAGVLGLFTDFLLFFPLASLGIVQLLETRNPVRRHLRRQVIIAHAATLALTLPWIIFKSFHVGKMLRNYLKPLDLHELYLLLFNFLPTGNAVLKLHVYQGIKTIHAPWQWLFLGLVTLFVGCLLVRGIYFLKDDFKGRALIVSLTLPILVVYLVSTYVSFRYTGRSHFIYLERTLSSLLVFIYGTILMIGAARCKRLWMRYAAMGGLIAVALTSTVLMVTVHANDWTVWLPNPDWKQFSQEVRPHLPHAVIFTNCPNFALRYYLESDEKKCIPLKIAEEGKKVELRSYLRKAFQAADTPRPRYFFLALNRYWDPYRGYAWNRQVFAKHFKLVGKKSYRSLDVFQYEVPQALGNNP